MTQNIVDVSFDLQKFDADRELLKNKMLETYAFLKTQSANLIPIGAGSWTEVTKAMNDQAVALEKTSKANLLAAKQIAQVEKNNILAAKAATESAKATLAQEKAEQQRLKTQQQQIDLTKKQTAANEQAAASAKSYNVSNVPFVYTSPNTSELAGATVLVNDLDRAQAAAAISAAEFGNSVNKSTTAISKQTGISKQTAIEVAKDAELKKQAERQANLELQNSVREQMAAKGSLEQRRAALIRLTRTYDNLNAQERNSPYGVRLQRTIGGVTDQLKQLEGATGRAQRNVGNYASALDKFGTRLESTFRRLLAYVSIFAVARFFKTVVTDTIDAENKTERFRATLENIGRSDVFARLEMKAKGFTDQFKYLDKHEVIGVFEQLITYGKLTENQIDALLPVITDFAAKQRISIEQATPIIIKALEGQSRGLKQYGINVKDAHSVTERLGIVMDELGPKVKGAAEAFGQTTQGKIASTKEDFVKLKEEIGNGLLPTINKLLDGLDRLINKFRTMKSDIDLNTGSMGGFLSKITQFLSSKTLDYDKVNGELERMKALKYGPHQVEESGPGIADYILPPDTNPDGNKRLGLGGNDDDGKGKKQVVLESVKNVLDLEFELYKIAQERKLKLLDDEVNDTKRSLMERVNLAEQYKAAQIELSDKTAEHEIKADKEKLKVLQDNFKKVKGTEKNNIAVEIDNATKEIQIAQAKQNDARLSAEDAFNQKYKQIVKDTEEQRVKAFKDAEDAIKNVREEQQSAIDADNATKHGALDKLLKEGVITQEEHDKRTKVADNQNKIDSLTSQLQAAKAKQNLEQLKLNAGMGSPEDLNKATNEVTTITGKLNSANNVTDKKDSDLDKRKEIVKDAELITATITNLVDEGYQKEINAIQRIIDLNNYRKDQEIKAINESTLSAQEKAARMVVLDNTVAANNRRLEREKAKIQIQEAKFDRDMAVLQILENVAAANFKLIAQGGFAGIALGVSVGLEAISAIAMLMAKPLPQMPAYAKGTDNHPGGPALVGEAGKELVTFPSGQSYLTSGPTLFGDLPKGSRVKPITKDVINQAMYNAMIQGTAERLQTVTEKPNRELIEAIEAGSRMTVQAMRKQKGANVVVNVNGDWNAYIQKNVRE